MSPNETLVDTSFQNLRDQVCHEESFLQHGPRHLESKELYDYLMPQFALWGNHSISLYSLEY
jgi:hypothetical protein